MTSLTANEIIAAAEQALEQENAPVVYLHPQYGGPATIAIVKIDWLRRYFDGRDLEQHGHIEAGEER